MVSAIVLVADPHRTDDLDHVREIVVRSLAWLVSATVAGLVRDVTLAGPLDVGLGAIADEAGCKVTEADEEAERLSAAVIGSREARLLVIRAGFQPDMNFAGEIDAFIRRSALDSVALVLATPETLLERILPDRAPVIAVLVHRERVGLQSFNHLARGARGATRLRARATRVD